jgi:WD40 repeat protein
VIGQLCDQLTGHTEPVNALAVVVLPDGRQLLASAGDDRSVRLWDPATGQPVAELVGHTSTVKALTVVVLPDGWRLLASAGSDRSVVLWVHSDQPTLGATTAARTAAPSPEPDPERSSGHI